MHTSLTESIQYVSDSLLIGETEKKRQRKTIGVCVHMDPNGSDPGGTCQLTQNQTPEANVCIKSTIKQELDGERSYTGTGEDEFNTFVRLQRISARKYLY